ncbi:MAG: CHASE2 domain-containing protein [Geminicoccaceae bacterium]
MPLALSVEEDLGLSLLFRTRGPVPSPGDVAIVTLDRSSAAELGLPEQIRDWPRRYHAQLIDRLVAGNAALIAFDVNFHQARDAEDDAALAQAIARAGRVILFEHTRASYQEVVSEDDEVTIGAIIEYRRPPLPAFADAAIATAPFPLPKVPASVSQFWTFKPGIDYHATLPAVAMQLSTADAMSALIEQIGNVDSTASMQSSAASDGVCGITEQMIEVRRWFQSNPAKAVHIAEQGSAAFEPLLRLYRGPDAHYLNYYGPPGQFDLISFASIVGDERSPGDLDVTGKAVFVGQVELEDQQRDDDFLTAFSSADGVNISGVEIAATAYANLLHGGLIKPTPRVLSWMALLLFGLLAGLTASLLPVRIVLPAALGLAALYGLGAYLLFARADLWSPLVLPLGLQLPAGVLAGLLVQYRVAQTARRNLSNAIRYYLPARVTSHLDESPFDPDFANETIYGACLVTDAEGFTTISERLKPVELKALLDNYFECLFEPAQRYGGVVTDVVGDGMTCVWTASQPDRACRINLAKASMRIKSLTQAFNREHRPLALPTRMGLHAGPLVIGNVGGAGHLRYTIVGDVVNTAARLEQLNKQLGTYILATDEAILDLETELLVRPLGAFRLVGKQEPVHISELIGPAAADRPSRLQLFATALARFQQGNWRGALGAFQTVLSETPEDGPALFYRDLTLAYLAGAKSPDDPSIVELERK